MLMRMHLERLRYYFSNVENRFFVLFLDNNEVRTAMGRCQFDKRISLIFNQCFSSLAVGLSIKARNLHMFSILNISGRKFMA